MIGERRSRILTQVVGPPPSKVETKRLCTVSADVTGTSGAGIMIISGDDYRASMCSSDPVSSLIEELQFALGEGPCIEACVLDRPVLEPDLVAASMSRWMAFSGPALAAGARAVFGFPIRVGGVRLGALNLYRDRAGPLSDEQFVDALVVADVAAELILVLQADAPVGRLAGELEASGSFHSVVHQATGMVAAQLGVSVESALVRLRAYAYGNERQLVDVARDVVSRTLRFDASSDESDGNE